MTRTIDGLRGKLAHLTAVTLLQAIPLDAWTLGVSPDRKILPTRLPSRNTAIILWSQMRRDAGHSWNALAAAPLRSPHRLLWLTIDIRS